jgi:hypothetical protein
MTSRCQAFGRPKFCMTFCCQSVRKTKFLYDFLLWERLENQGFLWLSVGNAFGRSRFCKASCCKGVCYALWLVILVFLGLTYIIWHNRKSCKTLVFRMPDTGRSYQTLLFPKCQHQIRVHRTLKGHYLHTEIVNDMHILKTFVSSIVCKC